MDLDKLYEPVDYIIKEGGKNIRGLLITYIQQLMKSTNNTLITQIIEDINIAHNASLVIDDIQDNSEIRRGKPAAHIVYGIPISINSAYLKCFTLLSNVKDKYPTEVVPLIQELMIDAFEKCHIGQGYDILWSKEKYIPTLDEYLSMINNKTGTGFTLLYNLYSKIINEPQKQSLLKLFGIPEVSKEIHELLPDLISNIIHFFQIRDDYINLTSPDYWRLKGFCEDFDEKKLSYIFVIFNDIEPDNNLYEILCKNDKLTDTNKIEIYKYLHDRHILHRVYSDLESYKEKIIYIDNKITKTTETSELLQQFFTKLQYNSPIPPSSIKDILLINKMKIISVN